MIIGNGLLARGFASRFATRNDTLIFASGVSNSQEESPVQFQREREMLLKAGAHHYGRFVYFGSCAVDDVDRNQTPYARHKLEMERLVLSRPGTLVVRLPQVIGPTGNPNTLINFLHEKIAKGEHFCVWARAERNLVDVDDVAAITEAALDRLGRDENQVIIVAARRSLPMLEIVAILERILGKKAVYTTEQRGSALSIDASTAHEIARCLGIDLGAGYAERILRKYYEGR